MKFLWPQPLGQGQAGELIKIWTNTYPSTAVPNINQMHQSVHKIWDLKNLTTKLQHFVDANAAIATATDTRGSATAFPSLRTGKLKTNTPQPLYNTVVRSQSRNHVS